MMPPPYAHRTIGCIYILWFYAFRFIQSFLLSLLCRTKIGERHPAHPSSTSNYNFIKFSGFTATTESDSSNLIPILPSL
jgi:hypothetical protein